MDSTATGRPRVCILWRGGVSCPVSAAWHFCVAAHWSKYHCYKQAPSWYDLRCFKATLNPNKQTKFSSYPGLFEEREKKEDWGPMFSYSCVSVQIILSNFTHFDLSNPILRKYSSHTSLQVCIIFWSKSFVRKICERSGECRWHDMNLTLLL